MALLIQISPALATDKDHDNRPVDITFTKWGVTAPPPPAPQPPFGLLEGFTDGGPVGSFVGEVLWRQPSLNGHGVGLRPCMKSSTRTGTVRSRRSSGAGRMRRARPSFDGVILAGWRAGARVQVVYQRYSAIAGMPSCEGAPLNKTCFVGIIHVGRAPRN